MFCLGLISIFLLWSAAQAAGTGETVFKWPFRRVSCAVYLENLILKAHCSCCFLHQVGKEIISLIIHQNKCRKIDYFNFPYSLHTELGIVNAFNFFNVFLG